MQIADRPRRLGRLATTVALCMALGSPLVLGGCRVNRDDIHRWETTANGPDKLRAVLLHEKYELPLRIEAALSLIRMKPRAGRRIGIGIMVETLGQVAGESRQAIVAGLVPAIIAELKKPPPVAQAGQPSPPDGSFPYKDAAYAMLNSERGVIVTDENLKQSLKAALVEWAMADFEHRLENRTQAYGMEQLLRFVGPAAVEGLPKLMTRDAKRLDQMAGLVSELGDAKTKEAASTALVAIATYVTSDEWTNVKTPEVQAANAASKLAPTEAQLKAQLAQFQEEELFRVFGAMKKVGGRPAIDYCLSLAAQKEQSEKRRQAALAAIEGKLDRNNPEDLKRVLAIASSDAPDVVLDQAFRRLGEMPRELVVDKLYELFRTEKWKVRRAAAGTVLKMSTVKHVDEFMSKLPDGSRDFAMAEALSYGASIGDLKDGKPLEAITKYFTSGSAAVRASALSYFFTHGTAEHLSILEPLKNEAARAPSCDRDPECKWVCDVPKAGASDPKERESKEIKTLGEFVQHCIVPAVKERAAAKTASKDEKKEEKK